MGRRLSRIVQVPLAVTLVKIVEPVDRWAIPCPGCGRGMMLHQPQEDYPSRLLGTCDHCLHWAAIELVSEGDAMLIDLPAPGSLVAPGPGGT